jgi:hypothetical protein
MPPFSLVASAATTRPTITALVIPTADRSRAKPSKKATATRNSPNPLARIVVTRSTRATAAAATSAETTADTTSEVWLMPTSSGVTPKWPKNRSATIQPTA